jgi:RIO-like serine/threonine protein kinase
MGIAPRLRGFEHIGGGWTMVVMDALDEGYVRIHDFEPETPIPNGVRDGLREKLAGLHQSDLVHGDIRDTDVLIKGNGEEGFMVLDFDWAGAVGEVRYPMNVYKGDDLWRPDGATNLVKHLMYM